MKALIIDNGDYTFLAELLARRGMEVAYFSSWANAFPLSRQMAVGTGIKGVTRVNDPNLYMLEQDPELVIVPDLYLGDYEAVARNLGYPVFGSNTGNILETDRWLLKEELTKAGLDVIGSVEIQGNEALEDYLRKHNDKHVKVSVLRGDMSSFHHENWDETQVHFWERKRRFGPIGEQVRFIVEDPIPDAVEVSIEGFFIDGELLLPYMIGYEIKDAGEFGFFATSLEQLPESIQVIIGFLGHFFAKAHYRNFFAAEVRIQPDGTAYLIDLAARIPVPPGYAFMSAVENLTEVLMRGGEGKATPLEVGAAKYLTEIKMKSPWMVEDFLHVRYDKKFEDCLAFENYCRIDGEVWVLPHVPSDPEIDSFGSAFGFGKNKETAAKHCKDAADSVKAYQAVYKSDVLATAEEEIEKGRKLGILDN